MRDLWLLIPRDLVALGVWVWSFASNNIVWRGEVFTVKDGKLVKAN
jgi:ceramide glucosyltransferase